MKMTVTMEHAASAHQMATNFCCGAARAQAMNTTAALEGRMINQGLRGGLTGTEVFTLRTRVATWERSHP
jgi:hypothetical protein